MISERRRAWRDLLPARGGIALTEFALVLPVFLVVLMGGAEIANYMTVRMRVSQLALHLADNAARIGEVTTLAEKRITEAQINDLLTGAVFQAGRLNFATNARIVVSSLQPVMPLATPRKYRIAWQRCFGAETHTPIYGTQDRTNMDGMGPTGSQVTAMDDGATIFVEVNYKYSPLINTRTIDFGEYTEIATMAVRDSRDLSDDSAKGSAATHPRGIYKVDGVTPATC